MYHSPLGQNVNECLMCSSPDLASFIVHPSNIKQNILLYMLLHMPRVNATPVFLEIMIKISEVFYNGDLVHNFLILTKQTNSLVNYKIYLEFFIS
jgi:hypothetical protein